VGATRQQQPSNDLGDAADDSNNSTSSSDDQQVRGNCGIDVESDATDGEQVRNDHVMIDSSGDDADAEAHEIGNPPSKHALQSVHLLPSLRSLACIVVGNAQVLVSVLEM
jgi:hypothetical protein